MNIKSGIYIIKNLVTKKVYIGQSQDAFKRLTKHKYMLKIKDPHENKHLLNSCNKHGIENFTFEVLELVENLSFLTSFEQSYLDYYRKLPGGVYNQVGPVDNPVRGMR